MISPKYNPAEVEDKWYAHWMDKRYFHSEPDERPAYSIVIPPPNVTGVLHMGHALMISWQDLLIRWNRMAGKKTLFIPGTDHAAIATQSKVEGIIKKEENLSRHDLGREEMLKRIEKFAEQSHDTIVNQVKKLGASCDWSREAFTLDADRNHAVNTVFKMMYDDGIIYRGTKVINWDPKGQTTISDDEIVYEERKAKLYTFKYSKDFPIAISTTRPETKIGDTAVAVNPNDERYTKYIGQTFEIPDFCGVKLSIKIVADESVEKEFGTGALGVTPAHSKIDEEIAIKNNLPSIQVINEYAKMMIGDERILGKKTTEAREVIVNWLKENDLMTEEVEISQNVSTAERTGGIVEPLPKLQWFINVNKEFTLKNSKINGIESGSKTTLKEIMKKSVSEKQIEIIPDNYEKVYFNWIDNLKDWCISRQVWYGHRIPVWYNEQNEIYSGLEAPSTGNWQQDEDTLDTWFSSGMWTFSTLGWPKETLDFTNFHPTSIIQPGTEILFFWVARMIMMSGYAIGDIPFKTVLLNGIVRDSQGRKMSKSLGNSPDPIEIAKKYGADAIRFYYFITCLPGTDSKLYEDKIKGYKHFTNKIWNIARFVLTQTKGELVEEKPQIITKDDEEILAKFSSLKDYVKSEIEKFHFHLAAENIYHFVWDDFASTILEDTKKIIIENEKNPSSENAERVSSRLYTISYILKNSILILHPFIPFVTEEIWDILYKGKRLLMTERLP